MRAAPVNSSAMTFTITHDFPPTDLEGAWRDCLTRVGLPSHYNAPEYFFEPQLVGQRPFAILAVDSRGAVTGVLTGLHQGHHLECGQISRPQICVDSGADVAATTDALARGVLEDGRVERVLSVYSWMVLDSFRHRGFRMRPMEGVVMLDLTPGPEAVFKQFDENRRRNIRAAVKHGIEVFQASTSEDFAAAYEVYLAWLRTPRKRILWNKMSSAVFEQTLRLSANRRLFLARHSGKVIAAVSLRFSPRGLLEFAANWSLDELMKLRPNDLLHWRVIEWACREGFPRYSLGGAHPFLRRFGGTVAPVYRYRLDRTWFHRHDLGEVLSDRAREWLRKMPEPIEQRIRRFLGKS